MPDLPDVDLWIALSVVGHPFQNRAEAYWADHASETIVFCRTTALGLVRVCSGKTLVGGTPLPVEDAWSRYEDWRREEGVALWDEPDGIDDLLSTWIGRGIVTPKLLTDAYLAAFAIRSGLRLVTFDADFERFPGLGCVP